MRSLAAGGVAAGAGEGVARSVPGGVTGAAGSPPPPPTRLEVTALDAAVHLLDQLRTAGLLPSLLLGADPALLLALPASTPPQRPGLVVHRLGCPDAHRPQQLRSLAELLSACAPTSTSRVWSHCQACRPVLSLETELIPLWEDLLAARRWWMERREDCDQLRRYLAAEAVDAPEPSPAALALARYRVEALAILARAAHPTRGEISLPPLPGCEEALGALRAELSCLAARASHMLSERLPDALLNEIATWHQGRTDAAARVLAASLQRAALLRPAPTPCLAALLEARLSTSQEPPAPAPAREQLRSLVLRRQARRAQLQARPRLVLLAPLLERPSLRLLDLPVLAAAARHTLVTSSATRLRLCWLPGAWARLLTPHHGCTVGRFLPAPHALPSLAERLDLLEAMGLGEREHVGELASAWEAAGCALRP